MHIAYARILKWIDHMLIFRAWMHLMNSVCFLSFFFNSTVSFATAELSVFILCHFFVSLWSCGSKLEKKECDFTSYTFCMNFLNFFFLIHFSMVSHTSINWSFVKICKFHSSMRNSEDSRYDDPRPNHSMISPKPLRVCIAWPTYNSWFLMSIQRTRIYCQSITMKIMVVPCQRPDHYWNSSFHVKVRILFTLVLLIFAHKLLYGSMSSDCDCLLAHIPFYSVDMKWNLIW